MRMRSLIGGIAAGLVALTGCAAPDSAPSTGEETTELVVFAAASFTTILPEIADEFTHDNPNVTITFSFDGSSSLVDQLKGGAPADVLITADVANMQKAVDADLVDGESTVFATNELTLIVPKDNPGQVTGLNASLDQKALVICADGVPCGTAARKLAALNNFTLKPVSEESKVTDVRGKVAAGQADAGIVYVTDAVAAGDEVTAISIPKSDQVRTEAPVAVTQESPNKGAAERFSAFLSGTQAQKILADAGFSGP